MIPKEEPAAATAGAELTAANLKRALKLIGKIDPVNPDDRRRFAEALLGPVRWKDPFLGFCRCPGEYLHPDTHPSRAACIRHDGEPGIRCD